MEHVPRAAGAPQIDPATVRRYAEALVGECLLVGPGDDLVIFCEPAHRQLAVAAVEAAAARGARTANVQYEDPAVRRAYLLHAAEEHLGTILPWEHALRRGLIGPASALLAITGEEQPGLLDDVPSERQGLHMRRRIAQIPYWSEANATGTLRFTIAGWPTEGWARLVHPESPPEEGARLLMDDILACARLAPGDAPGAITAHVAALARRSAILEGLGIDRLELAGPGTELAIGMPRGAAWWYSGRPDAYGRATVANWPSEELFSSPDHLRVEGTFTCTRPLAFLGRMIHGLRGEIVDGRLARLESDDPEGAATVLGYLDADEGGRRLGEVALVDTSSRIWQRGRTFFDTLYDENAAAHIAFGNGFLFTAADDAGREAINRAGAHLDVMVGSDQVSITGVDAGGARVPLIEEGRWRI